MPDFSAYRPSRSRSSLSRIPGYQGQQQDGFTPLQANMLRAQTGREQHAAIHAQPQVPGASRGQQQPGVFEAGERVHHIQRPDGAYIPVAAATGDAYLVRPKGKTTLFSPNSGEEFGADPASPVGISSVTKARLAAAAQKEQAKAQMALAKEETAQQKEAAKEAEAALKLENARKTDQYLKEGRAYNISRETGAPMPKQSDEEWQAAKTAKMAELQQKAAAKPFKAKLDELQLELDNPDLPKVSERDLKDVQEKADSAAATIKAARSNNDYESPLTDDEIQQALADPARRAAASEYIQSKKELETLPKAIERRKGIEREAYQLKKRILDPEGYKADLAKDVKAAPTAALRKNADEIEAQAKQRQKEHDENKAALDKADADLAAQHEHAQKQYEDAKVSGDPRILGMAGDALAQIEEQMQQHLEDSEDRRISLSAEAQEINRDVEHLGIVAGEINKRREAQIEQTASTIDKALPGAGEKYKAAITDGQKRADALKAKYPDPEAPEAKAAFEAFQKDVQGKVEAITKEAQAKATERADDLRAARVAIERDGFEADTATSMKKSGLDPKNPKHKAAYFDANKLINLERPDKSDWKPGDNIAKGHGSATLSDGALHVNPQYYHDPLKYAKVVEASEASDEEKAKAIADLPRLQLAFAESVLPMLKQAGSTKAAQWIPGIASFQKWQAETKPTGTEAEQASQYLAEMNARGAWSKGADNVLRSLLAGFADIGTMAAGTVGLLSSSQTASEAAADWSKRSSDFMAPVSLEGGDSGLGSAILGQTARMAGPMAATLLVTRGLGGGMVTMSALSAAQTAGSQYADSYGQLRERGMKHGEAWKKTAPYALASGMVTAVLTAAGGRTGFEAALGTKAGKEAAQGFWRSLARNVPKQALAEIPEELPDELFSQVSQALATDPNADVPAIIGKFWEDSPSFLGAIALMGGAGGVMETRQQFPKGGKQELPTDLDEPTPGPTLPEDLAAADVAISSWMPKGPLPNSVQDAAKAAHGKEPTPEQTADTARSVAQALVNIAQGQDPRAMSPEVRRMLGIKTNSKDGSIEPASKNVMPLVESVADPKGKHHPVITDAAREWLTNELPSAGALVKLSYAERADQIKNPPKPAKKAVAKQPKGAKMEPSEVAPSGVASVVPEPVPVASGTAGAGEGGETNQSSVAVSTASMAPKPAGANAGSSPASGAKLPRADSPSPNLPPRATTNAPPRPARNGRDTTARDAWDEQYQSTHNEDGTPYQPTVLDEVVAKVRVALAATSFDENIDSIGVDNGIEARTALEQLLNDGWEWNDVTGKMVNPANPSETPNQGLHRIRSTKAPKSKAPEQKPQPSASSDVPRGTTEEQQGPADFQGYESQQIEQANRDAAKKALNTDSKTSAIIVDGNGVTLQMGDRQAHPTQNTTLTATVTDAQLTTDERKEAKRISQEGNLAETQEERAENRAKQRDLVRRVFERVFGSSATTTTPEKQGETALDAAKKTAASAEVEAPDREMTRQNLTGGALIAAAEQQGQAAVDKLTGDTKAKGAAALKALLSKLRDYNGKVPLDLGTGKGGTYQLMAGDQGWKNATLVVNPGEIVRLTAVDAVSTKHAAKMVQLLFRHEVIHAKVVTKITVKKAQEIWLALSDEARAAVTTAYSVRLVALGMKPESFIGKDFHATNEYIRALVEIALQGPTSERIISVDLANKPMGKENLRKWKDFLAEVLTILKDLKRQFSEVKSPEVRDRLIADVDGLVKQVAEEIRNLEKSIGDGAENQVATPETNATPESTSGKPAGGSSPAVAPQESIKSENESSLKNENPKQGTVGMKLAAGEVVLTATGRRTTPFPRLDMDSNRKVGNTLKRVDMWLRENAIAEAKARGDDFNLPSFEAENPAKMPQATKDGMELYLFDPEFAAVTTKKPALVASKPTAEAPKAQDSAENAVPPAKDAIDEALGAAFEGLSSPPQPGPVEQVAFPKDRREVMMKAASTVIDLGLKTPQELAKRLDGLRPGGALRKYARAFWRVMTGFDESLEESPDWNAVFAGIDQPITQMPPNESLAEQPATAEANVTVTAEMVSKWFRAYYGGNAEVTKVLPGLFKIGDSLYGLYSISKLTDQQVLNGVPFGDSQMLVKEEDEEAAPEVSNDTTPTPTIIPERGDTVTWIDGAGKPATATVDKITTRDGTQYAWLEWFGTKEVPLDQLTVKTKSGARLAREKREAEAANIPVKEVTTPEKAKEKKPTDTKALRAMKTYLLEKLDDAIAAAPDEAKLGDVRKDLVELMGLSDKSTTPNVNIAMAKLREKYNLDPKAKKADIDAAVRASVPAENKVVIEIPGDGTFTLWNDKKTLQNFAKIAKSFPTTTPSADTPTLNTIRPSGIPTLKSGKASKSDIVKVAGMFTSTDETRQAIMQVADFGDTLVATNGKMMFKAPFEGEGTADDPVLFSAKGSKIGPQSEHEEDYGKYPNWKAVMPDDLPTIHKGIDTGRLWQILKQASSIARDVNFKVKNGKGQTEDVTPYVAISINQDGSLGVKSQVSNNGLVETYAHNIQEGSDPVGTFDAELFMDALAGFRALGQEKVAIKSGTERGEGPIMLTSPDAEVIIMRVKTQVVEPTMPERDTKVEIATTQQIPAENRPARDVWTEEYANYLAQFKAKGGEANSSILNDVARKAMLIELPPDIVYQDFINSGVTASKATYAVQSNWRGWMVPSEAIDSITQEEVRPPPPANTDRGLYADASRFFASMNSDYKRSQALAALKSGEIAPEQIEYLANVVEGVAKYKGGTARDVAPDLIARLRAFGKPAAAPNNATINALADEIADKIYKQGQNGNDAELMRQKARLGALIDPDVRLGDQQDIGQNYAFMRQGGITADEFAKWHRSLRSQFNNLRDIEPAFKPSPPSKFTPGQRVSGKKEGDFNRKGAIGSTGPTTDGERTWFVQTDTVGPVLYKESELTAEQPESPDVATERINTRPLEEAERNARKRLEGLQYPSVGGGKSAEKVEKLRKEYAQEKASRQADLDAARSKLQDAYAHNEAIESAASAIEGTAPEVASIKSPRKPRAPKKPTLFERLQAYFVPGAIVDSYGGKDRVVALHPDGGIGQGGWSVEVVSVDKDGKDTPGARVRRHSTLPSEKELQKAWENRPDASPLQSPPTASARPIASVIRSFEAAFPTFAAYMNDNAGKPARKKALTAMLDVLATDPEERGIFEDFAALNPDKLLFDDIERVKEAKELLPYLENLSLGANPQPRGVGTKSPAPVSQGGEVSQVELANQPMSLLQRGRSPNQIEESGKSPLAGDFVAATDELVRKNQAVDEALQAVYSKIEFERQTRLQNIRTSSDRSIVERGSDEAVYEVRKAIDRYHIAGGEGSLEPLYEAFKNEVADIVRQRDEHFATVEAANYLSAEERAQQSAIDTLNRRWASRFAKTQLPANSNPAPFELVVNRTGETIPFATQEAADRWVAQYRTSGLGGEFTLRQKVDPNYLRWWQDILDQRDEEARAGSQTAVAKVWRAIAQHDEAFQYGKTSRKSAADIAAAVSLPGKLVTARDSGDTVRFMGPNGHLDIHKADTDRPYIRSTGASSQGKKGGGGTQLYQAALDWIHNNGKRIKDDSGLTSINAIRRTSNFASSALRWGTTKHLKPHAAQKVPWGKNDTLNTAALLSKEMDHAFKAIAEAREWEYDFARDQFLDSTGQPLERERFEQAGAAAHPEKSGIGVATLERAVVTRSSIEAFQSGRAEELVSALGVREDAPERLKGALYANPQPRSQSITDMAAKSAAIVKGTQPAEVSQSIKRGLLTLPEVNKDERIAMKGKGASVFFQTPAKPVTFGTLELRNAFQKAATGKSTAVLTIREVFNAAKERNPGLNAPAFMAQVKADYYNGLVGLEPPEQASTVEAAGPFKLRDSMGIESTSMSFLPTTEAEMIDAAERDERTPDDILQDWANTPLQSNPTVSNDAEYMAAVESGDMAKAQAMVDAADMARYKTSRAQRDAIVKVAAKLTDSPEDAGERATLKRSLMDTFTVPTGFKLEGIGDTRYGSIYIFVNDPGFNEKGEETDPSSYKLSIRDHEPSPFREKEFGKVDHYREVSDINDFGQISEAMTQIEDWLDKKGYNQDPVTRDADGNVIPLSQRFNPQSDSILYSNPQPAIDPAVANQGSTPGNREAFAQQRGRYIANDAEYMAAVESGDMAKAQAMVDEAAQAAGYDLPVFHGSSQQDITQFDPEKAGSVQYSDWGKGIYLTPYPDTGDYYREESVVRTNSKVQQAWQDFEDASRKMGTTPMNMTIDLGFYSERHLQLLEWEKKWREALKSVRSDKSLGRVYNLLLKARRPLLEEGGSMADPYLAERAKTKGHDAIFILTRSGAIDEIVAFDPSQIKSADPVTRDDAGNVIPLSKRFNPQSDSILYAPPQPAIDPAVANQGSTPGNREAFAQQRGRYIAEELEQADFDAIRTAVGEQVDADEQGMLDNILYKVENDELLTLEEEVGRRILADRLRTRGTMEDDANLIRMATRLWGQDIASGTDTARKLAMRVDQFESPQERLNAAIGRILAPNLSRARERLTNTWTPSAKRREIARLEADIAEANGNAAKERLKRVLDAAKARLDRDEVIQKMAEENEKKVNAILSRIGLSASDLHLTPDDRHSMQMAVMEMPHVKRHMEAQNENTRKAIEMSVRGYADDAIVEATGLPLRQVEQVTEDFRTNIAKQAISQEIKVGKQTFGGIIEAGKNLLKWILKAPPQPLGRMVAAGTVNAAHIQNQILRILNATIPTRRQRNRRTLHAKKVKGKNGQLITVFIPYDPTDWKQVYRVARELSTRDATKIDKMYEYWINGILSGPQTHVVNTASNLLSAAWHYGPQWFASATVNSLGIRDPRSTQWGEFRHLWGGFIKGVIPALQNFALAWNTEADPVEYQYLDKPVTVMFENGRLDKVGGRGPSIGGTPGRVIRTPGRFLVAADAFAKTIIMHGEAAAYAYRTGKEKGLHGVALENFIASQVATYGSESWADAFATATELTFQDENEITKNVEKFVNAGKKMKFVGLLFKFLFPFVRTPTNIYRAGIRKAGGSAGMLLYRLGKAGFYKMKDGTPFFDSYSKGKMVKDVSESVMAGLLWMALMALSEGDTDEEESNLTVTGSRPYGVANAGERASQLRQEGGSNLIIIRRNPITGKKLDEPIRIPYGRYEPMALAIGTLADAAREFKEMTRMAPGDQGADKLAGTIMAHLAAQAQDKTFLQGVAGLSRLIEDITTNKLAPGEAFAKQFVNGVVPNLVRQPLRLMPDTLADAKKPNQILGSTTIGAALSDAEPKINEAGKPVTRTASGITSTMFPVATEPSQALFDSFLKTWNTKKPSEQWNPDPITKGDWYVYDPAQGSKEGKFPLKTSKAITRFESMVGTTFASMAAKELIKLGYRQGGTPTPAMLEAVQNARTEAIKITRKLPPSLFSK